MSIEDNPNGVHEIVVGQKFPFPEKIGEKVESELGTLYKNPLYQLRDGQLRWYTRDGTTIVLVDSEGVIVCFKKDQDPFDRFACETRKTSDLD